MKIIDLGLIDYPEAYKIQKDILKQRKNGDACDTLIVAEHLPVFTIGRAGSRDNLLVDKKVLEQKGIKLIEVDRGGDITFHGPGQIVLYPIVNLKERSLDLHRFIRNLEELVLRFLSSYDINARRVEGKSGVWVQGKKICSVGIGVSRWTSFHGISVNINTDLSYFSMIRSCGINSIEMTSLAKILNETIDMGESKKRLISIFDQIINANETVSALD